MSDWVVPVVLLVAMWFSFRLLASRLRGVREELERAQSIHDSSLTELRDEFERRIGTLGTLLSMQSSGRKVTVDMIRDGRAYHNVDAREVQAMVESNAGVLVVDVRTPGEYESGHIPGAKHIPLDEMPTRYREIPPDVERVVVHCEAGGRAVAACDYLTGKGYMNLFHMVGGIHAWKGPRETGKAS